MKKFLLLGTILLATNVWAFGGIGIGPWQRHKNQGVDAIGVHVDSEMGFDEEKQPTPRPMPSGTDGGQVDEPSCAVDEEPWEGNCVPKCESNLRRSVDGACTRCANGNVYLSVMDEPCGTAGSDEPITCNLDSDCFNGCCNEDIHLCMAQNFEEEVSNTCPDNTAKFCKNNQECGTGEFCSLQAKYYQGPPVVGTCRSLGNGTEYTWNGRKFLLSEDLWCWWSAENWCKAQGKELVQLSDFVDTTKLPKPYGDYYYCTGNACVDMDWDGLLAVFGQTSWWTNDRKNSFMEQMITLGSRKIGDDGRMMLGAHYALCK